MSLQPTLLFEIENAIQQANVSMGKGHNWLLHKTMENNETIIKPLNCHIFATKQDINIISTAFSFFFQGLSIEVEK